MDNQIYSYNTQKYLQCFYNIFHQMKNDMDNAQLYTSLSMSFINQMIPHHQGAIAMSQNLLCYTTNIELQNIAIDIIESQKQSIQNMKNIYACCTQINNEKEINDYLIQYQKITQTMFEKMKNSKTDNSIDVSFIHEMIPHHEGAIQLSKSILQYPICPQLHPILEAIIVSQEKGVQEMKAILKKICSTNN